ncbi:hypothetical protein Hanom_Chr05g00391571 [Helianthus anomalus]
MWHPRRIRSHLGLPLVLFETSYQISGQTFFQVGDDVTTRVSRYALLLITSRRTL